MALSFISFAEFRIGNWGGLLGATEKVSCGFLRFTLEFCNALLHNRRIVSVKILGAGYLI